MGFLENLTKGFIRSAVNQVGRDGGRILSNKIYHNDGSSNPINIVDQEISTSDNKVLRSNLINMGYRAETFESGASSYILILLGSLVIPIFGPLYWLFIAARNLFRKRLNFYATQQMPAYVRDKRYKTGQRQEGYRNVKVYSKSLVTPTLSERGLFIGKGIVALAIAFSISYFQYSAIISFF